MSETPRSADSKPARPASPVKGRGALRDLPNRFETVAFVLDPEVDPASRPSPETLFLRDASKSILCENDSPDIPFELSLNPYRGCEHGCVYCYARPTHEYLGFSPGLEFETRIMVKTDAPALLEAELARPRYRPRTIALSGVTDCYQPAERTLQITRGCLEVLARCRHPVGIVTKSQLVTRDVDLLAPLSARRAARFYVSVTTLDPELARSLEPRAAAPGARLAAIRTLRDAGVEVGVMVAPIIPGLNDEEIPAILEAAQEAGARHAGRVLLRLPHGVKELFEDWLRAHVPLKADKVLNRIRSTRGGSLNDARFGHRMKGSGPFAELAGRLFDTNAAALGLAERPAPLETRHFVPPGPRQLKLF